LTQHTPETQQSMDRVLAVIERCAAAGICGPTRWELAIGLGISIASVRYVLVALERRGLLRIAHSHLSHLIFTVIRTGQTTPTISTHTPIDPSVFDPTIPNSPKAKRPVAEPRATFRRCRYIEGHPKDAIRQGIDIDTLFCGEPVTSAKNGEPSSYCAEHHARCWQPIDRNHKKNRLRKAA